MKELSLSNLLRYVFPSFVLYLYFLIADGKLLTSLHNMIKINSSGSSETVNWVSVLAFIFVGSLIYLVYNVIYRWLIINIQDWCRIWGKSKNNYRTVIKEKYGITSSYQAQQIWLRVKNLYLQKEYHSAMLEHASGCHLLYMSGLLALVMTAVTCQVNGTDDSVWWLLGIGCALCIAAFFSDRSYEDIEVRIYWGMDDCKASKVDATIKKLVKKQDP